MQDAPEDKDFVYTVGRELIRLGCRIDYSFKTILVPSHSVGLKVWSLIDYMCNKQKFTWRR